MHYELGHLEVDTIILSLDSVGGKYKVCWLQRGTVELICKTFDNINDATERFLVISGYLLRSEYTQNQIKKFLTA